MPALQRINAPDALADYLDSADEVYGSGVDGNATLTGSGNAMTADMYYYNLTLANSAVLDTAGYRLFVKNVLTIGTGVVIGRTGGATAVGTLKAGTATQVGATNSLGGNGYTNSVPPTPAQGGAAYYQQASQAIKGYNITASMTQPEYLQGGSGGPTGDVVGGGVVIIAARYIASSGASQIAATGGVNAGGGVIILVSTASVLNSNITLNVQGNGTGTAGTANYIEVD